MATVEERLAKLEARVEEHSQLFVTMREALLAFEHRMEVRFDGIEKRFDSIDRRFEAVDRRFEAIDRRFDVIDRRFELSEIPEALRYLGEGHARGKVVITV